MENKFFIGIVLHKKKFLKSQYTEKVVLFSNDDINYIDLLNDLVYTTDISNRDYVVKESLIPTDIYEHRIDYMYLLSQYHSKIMTRKKSGKS